MLTPGGDSDDDPADDSTTDPAAEAIHHLDDVLHEWWARHGESWRYRRSRSGRDDR